MIRRGQVHESSEVTIPLDGKVAVILVGGVAELELCLTSGALDLGWC
jgi:hypothetical protein